MELEKLKNINRAFEVLENTPLFGPLHCYTAAKTAKERILRLQQQNEKLKEVVQLFAEYNELFADRKCYAIPGVKIKIACEILKEVCGEEKKD